MNESQTQLRSFLESLRKARWVATIIGCALVALAACFFVNSLIELRKAGASREWPSVEGRVFSSEVADWQERAKDSAKWTTFYRPIIRYSYQVDGTEFESLRVSFTGWGGSTGTNIISDKSAADLMVSRYPRGAVVQVFYNPRNPSEAVLETGTSDHNQRSLLDSILCLMGAIVFWWGSRRLIAWFMRGVVTQAALQIGPQAWEVAAEYRLTSPSSRERTEQKPT